MMASVAWSKASSWLEYRLVSSFFYSLILLISIMTLMTIPQVVFRYKRGHAAGLVALDDVSFSDSCLFAAGPPCKVKPFEILNRV